MTREAAERHLSAEILDKATLRGNEHAWRLDDIPDAIEAAREADLVNLGGQLQFRFPDGGICECDWVSVDIDLSNKNMPWPERVEASANEAAAKFRRLRAEVDFAAEGRKEFVRHLAPLEAGGTSPDDLMFFVWYVFEKSEAEENGW